MRKKIPLIALALMAVTLMINPVFAIGPQNAVKNPNAVFDLGWAQLILPSGQFTEWVPAPSLGATILFQHKSADDFQIKNAMPMTINMASPSDMMAFFEAENNWVYLSQISYYNFLFNSFVLQTGPDIANAIATYYSSMYPNGLYIRIVIIGN